MRLQKLYIEDYKNIHGQSFDLTSHEGLTEAFLQDNGVCRVHGGGFAGTVQAFVPFEILDSFRAGIDGVLGEGACHVLSIRPQGGVEMKE